MNLVKTQIVVYGKKGHTGKNDEIVANNKIIKEVDFYKYLGAEIEKRGIWKCHILLVF